MSGGLLDQARRQWATYLWDLWQSGEWDTQPETERDYSQRQLAAHLDEAGAPDAQVFALVDERWLHAWWSLDGTYEGFLADVERAWRRAERARDLVVQIKCALCAAGGSTLSANVSAELLALAVQHQALMPDQALAIVRRAAENERAPLMIALAPHLPPRYYDQALDVAASLTRIYGHRENRDAVLATLAPNIPPLLQPRAIELAQTIGRQMEAAHAIAALAPHVAVEQIDSLLAAARSLSVGEERARALTGVATRLNGPIRDAVAEEAYTLARQVEIDEDRFDRLIALLDVAHGQLRARVLRSALATARTMRHQRVDGRDDAQMQATALAELLPRTSSTQRETFAKEVLNAIRGGGSSERTWLLEITWPHLPARSIGTAFRLAVAVDASELRYTFEGLAQFFTPRQLAAAARRARRVRSAEQRTAALLALAPAAAGVLRDRLTEDIVKAAARLDERERARTLSAVAPLAGPGVIRRALSLARRIADPAIRASALAELVRFAPAKQQLTMVPDIWKEAETCDDERRLSVVSDLWPLMPPTMRRRLERSRRGLVRRVGSNPHGAGTVQTHALMLMRVHGIDEAHVAAATIRRAHDRLEALIAIAAAAAPADQHRSVRAAIDAARVTDDEQALASFMKAAAPRVDLDELSCLEQMGARAGFYADGPDDPDPDEDEDEEDDKEDDVDVDGDEESASAGSDAADEDVAAEIEQATRLASQSDRAAALRRLARVAGQGNLKTLLDATATVDEFTVRAVLEAIMPRLSDEHWPQALDVADSINDHDERAEAWMAIARDGRDEDRHAAQEAALAAIAEATNEDEYHEPLLRLAADLPDDLIPRAFTVAAELLQQEDEERRARVFTGLAQDFRSWVTRDADAARTGWNDMLRAMSRRPRADFVYDLAGFHHLGRLLVDPADEESYVAAVREVVTEVCRWR